MATSNPGFAKFHYFLPLDSIEKVKKAKHIKYTSIVKFGAMTVVVQAVSAGRATKAVRACSMKHANHSARELILAGPLRSVLDGMGHKCNGKW